MVVDLIKSEIYSFIKLLQWASRGSSCYYWSHFYTWLFADFPLDWIIARIQPPLCSNLHYCSLHSILLS